MTRHYPSRDEHCAPSYITIDHADPVILISDEFLHTVAWDSSVPTIGDLKYPADHYARSTSCWSSCPHRGHARHCWTDWVFTIEARNRTVIYRIGNYQPQHHAWEASWPD